MYIYYVSSFRFMISTTINVLAFHCLDSVNELISRYTVVTWQP